SSRPGLLVAGQSELPRFRRDNHANGSRVAVKFLEAHQIVSRQSGGHPLPFLLAMSGTSEPLELYVRAHAAQRGRSADVRILSFNTLQQTLLEPPRAGEREVFLLLPWDLVPVLDWRTGFSTPGLSLSELRAEADRALERIARRQGCRVLYLPATLPPILGQPRR